MEHKVLSSAVEPQRNSNNKYDAKDKVNAHKGDNA